MQFISPWTALLLADELIVAWIIVRMLRRPRDPRTMIAWILALALLPYLGLLLYLVFGEPRRRWHHRRRRRRRRRLGRCAPRLLQDRLHGASGPGEPAAWLDSLMRLARRLTDFPATRGNDVVLYHDPESVFAALQQAIESAGRSIHLEYYIFQPDETGRMIRDLLIARARAGVECRLLLDYIGCWRLGRSFVRPMLEAGVKVAFALPMIPLRGRWRVNYRNHRKIVVIDGRTGFTGSKNIGDEYRGRLEKYGPWRDTHMRITGPAVLHLQDVFAEDWHYTTGERLLSDRYFPEPPGDGRHVVQIVPSGPDQDAPIMHQMLFAAVSAARTELEIITPYFVPDTSMVLALQSAAYRGVRVRLMIPARTDHRVVLWAGRGYYADLCRAGVEILEHDRIMLHSKVMIVDREWAMVGSANMDERSFRTNFELSTLLYSRALAEELHADFESLRAGARPVGLRDTARQPPLEGILMGLARLASPLL